MVQFKTPFYKKYIEPNHLNLPASDLSYLAGIVDTDGSISLGRVGKSVNVPKYKVLIDIANNSDNLINWLKTRIPKYNLRVIRFTNKVFTAYHIGICWYLVENLIDRLVLKHGQAKLAREALELKYRFWRSKNKNYIRRMDELHRKMKWLNRKGTRKDDVIENNYYDTIGRDELNSYLAGVFDGDGAIYTNNKDVVALIIGTKSKSYADWLGKHIECSFVYRPPSVDVWLVSVKTDYFVYQLLKNICPYSVIKREQIGNILRRVQL